MMMISPACTFMVLSTRLSLPTRHSCLLVCLCPSYLFFPMSSILTTPFKNFNIHEYIVVCATFKYTKSKFLDEYIVVCATFKYTKSKFLESI
jgi:hypothetical protein